MKPTPEERDKLAKAVTKGIAFAENGGKVNINNPIAGKSGEMKSIFQYTPETWKLYSKEILGREVPLNADYETYVTNEKVKKWIDEGHNTSQIASMWNAGPSKPNAYKEKHKGINKFGVKYDTPTYAKKVLDYSKEFYTNQNSNISNENNALTTQKRDLNTFPIDGLMNGQTKNQVAEKLPGLFSGNVNVR